ncbi:hypothetical protein AMECASPLE_032050 [Ameca splendens]|uniref:Uncharacterized protein n=1 Tax=Ameca splendens TaxID=208324 RepID=A0ABV0ZF83_9TELE
MIKLSKNVDNKSHNHQLTEELLITEMREKSLNTLLIFPHLRPSSHTVTSNNPQTNFYRTNFANVGKI